MPQTRSRRRARAANNRRARLDFAPPAPAPAPKPVWGLKLKTVSAFTLAFSLVCLAAFAASRPPIPSGPSPTVATSERSAQAKHSKSVAHHPTTAR